MERKVLVSPEVFSDEHTDSDWLTSPTVAGNSFAGHNPVMFADSEPQMFAPEPFAFSAIEMSIHSACSGTNRWARRHSTQTDTSILSSEFDSELLNDSIDLASSGVRESTTLNKRLEGGTKVINNYAVISTLGVGSFSKVKLCFDTESRSYFAMKIIDKLRIRSLSGIAFDAGLEKVRREIAVLKLLRHPNIISLHEVIDDPRSRKIYLILELATLGPTMNLDPRGNVLPGANQKTKLTIDEVRETSRAVTTAMAYAHSQGVVHRDIKPQNILLTGSPFGTEVKLADFGVSLIVGEPCLSGDSVEGTIPFLPPELLTKLIRPLEAASPVDHFKADVWSFGVTMYLLCSGKMPWEASSATSLLDQILHAPVFPVDERWPLQLVDFLRRALNVKSQLRPTFAELMNHPWIATDDQESPSPDDAVDPTQEQLDEAVTIHRTVGRVTTSELELSSKVLRTQTVTAPHSVSAADSKLNDVNSAPRGRAREPHTSLSTKSPTEFPC